MPIQIFTAAERTRLDAFPAEITHDDLITFFTLSEADREQLPLFSAPHNRLGFVIQLCTLRFMGFVPEDLTHLPPAVVAYVARQIEVEPTLVKYGAQAQTRTDHFNVVQHYLGYRRAEQTKLTELSAWLLERALEHDKPPLLFELACQKFRTEKVVRPAVWRVEQLITAARHQAQTETMRRLVPLLTAEKKEVLDAVLVPDPTIRGTPLAWLRRPATTNSPKAIVGESGEARLSSRAWHSHVVSRCAQSQSAQALGASWTSGGISTETYGFALLLTQCSPSPNSQVPSRVLRF